MAGGEDKKKLALPAVYVGLLVIIVVSGFFAILAGYVTRKYSSNPNADLGIGPNSPRLLALSSVTLTLIGLGLIGAGAKATYDISAISFLAGLAPPANFGTIALLLSSVLGLWATYSVLQARKQSSIRRRTIIGLPLLGLSTVLLFLYLASWGISPF